MDLKLSTGLNIGPVMPAGISQWIHIKMVLLNVKSQGLDLNNASWFNTWMKREKSMTQTVLQLFCKIPGNAKARCVWSLVGKCSSVYQGGVPFVNRWESPEEVNSGHFGGKRPTNQSIWDSIFLTFTDFPSSPSLRGTVEKRRHSW